jgi:hypothetical protein
MADLRRLGWSAGRPATKTQGPPWSGAPWRNDRKGPRLDSHGPFSASARHRVSARDASRGPYVRTSQRELYDVFYRMGTGLGIPALPRTYAGWRADRERHLRRDLVHGGGTDALYAQYRKQLGPWRYDLLLRLQSILTPEHVRGLLRLKRAAWLRPLPRLIPSWSAPDCARSRVYNPRLATKRLTLYS